MQMRYRLGLDVGSNSLGWCVLELNEDGEPFRIEAAGSRIFSDGRQVKSKATLKAERRVARSARRRHDRYKQRRNFLICELTKLGLFPEDKSDRLAIQILNPFELRAKALTEKLPLHYIGRALFHINQRRGFKSNRKDRSEESSKGMVSNSVRALLEEMGLIGVNPTEGESYRKLSKEEKRIARQNEAENRKQALTKLAELNTTFGEFLWNRIKKGQSVRARPLSDSKLYDVYPTREMLEDEFVKIWNSQKQYYPDILTIENFDKIHSVIFYQRKLKPPVVGQCIYFPKEKRTFRAMPSFQRYRILSEVNNIKWVTSSGTTPIIDHADAQIAVVNLLEQPSVKTTPTDRNAKVGFAKIKTILRKTGVVEGEFRINLETFNRKDLDGNQTTNVMQHEDYVGTAWHSWSMELQDKFIEIILDDELGDEEVHCRLMNEFGLSEFSAINCTKAPLVEGTASLSLKAARELGKYMSDGPNLQSDAVQKASSDIEEFVNPYTFSKDRELLDCLPYYGKAFQDKHIIPGERNIEDLHDEYKYYGGVTNPTVHISLNQIRHVINELIDIYGHPESIAIELARDLPLGPEGRREIEKEQRDNRATNERLGEKLNEQGLAWSRDNLLKLRLWEELDPNDPNGRCCPFSGKKIGFSDVFSASIEIEHIIPYSISLDDSRSNKVLCTGKANSDKGNKTPFEAFGSSPEGYNWHEIHARAQRLPNSKKWRFEEDAKEKWFGEHADFLERHLNDTRYIGRLAKEYLEFICPFNKIDVLTGRHTAMFRWHWGLNSVLAEDRSSESDNTKYRKLRDDHRHHAIDAIVIGMTTKSMLQKVSREAEISEETELDRIFPRGVDGKSPIDPWQGFRNEVKDVVGDIVVSHKIKRKKVVFGATDGQLHNDTAYGVVSEPNDKGLSTVVVRRSVESLTDRNHLERIRDVWLKHQFKSAFDEAVNQGELGKKGVVDLAKKKGIRSLRCVEPMNVIPIRDKYRNVYKYFKGDSNWGMEIFEYPKGHHQVGKWEGIVISRFVANQPDFQPGCTCRPHPAARLIMRLQINDCIEIEENGKTKIIRLQKVSQLGVLEFASHFDANVDARMRDKDDSFDYLRRTASSLKKLNPRKVHISPTGRVSYEQR